MKQWHLLEQVTTSDGSVMTLHTNGDDRVIRVNGRELMSTRHHNSEDQLAIVACAPLRNTKGVHVLIGGLGLGFTLRAALENLALDAQVDVAELMPEVVAWNQNPAYQLAGECLKDPRTRIVMGDVRDIIAKRNGIYHAIMLDTDNGTTAMSTAGNEALYQRKGLEQVRAALRPRGTVVYWSASEEPIFAKLMEKNGFAVEIQRPRMHISSGGRHVLLIGRKK